MVTRRPPRAQELAERQAEEGAAPVSRYVRLCVDAPPNLAEDEILELLGDEQVGHKRRVSPIPCRHHLAAAVTAALTAAWAAALTAT